MGKIAWILPWGEQKKKKKSRVRRRLVCVWHGEVQFKNPCCSCMLLNEKKNHQNICQSSPGQRSAGSTLHTDADREGDGGLCYLSPLITLFLLPSAPTLFHHLLPLSQHPDWLRIAQLSRLEAFTETAPKRKARMWKNVCDFGWHKSSQRCPFVKDFQLLWNL